jgi:hypothetical protein
MARPAKDIPTSFEEALAKLKRDLANQASSSMAPSIPSGASRTFEPWRFA